MLGVMLAKLIVKRVKGYAVVYISWRNLNIQHKIVLVAGCMSLVCKALLMLSLVENSALRVGRRNNCFLFFCAFVVVVKGLLVVFFAAFVYLFLFCLSCHLYHNGVAIQIEEYVPTSNPINNGNVN